MLRCNVAHWNEWVGIGEHSVNAQCSLLMFHAYLFLLFAHTHQVERGGVVGW